MIGAALFLFRFFDFLPHLLDFLLRQLCKLCQFVLKLADMVEIYPDMLDSVSRALFVALMHFDFADKLIENSRGSEGRHMDRTVENHGSKDSPSYDKILRLQGIGK